MFIKLVDNLVKDGYVVSDLENTSIDAKKRILDINNFTIIIKR